MGLLSRRAFLAGIPAIQIGRAAGKGQQFPSEARRYVDELTDREVWRLSGPSRACYFPDCYQRFASEKNSFVLMGAELAGEMQMVRMELPSGRMTQLTQGSGVVVDSICLAPDERSVFFLQGGTLKHMGLRGLREREIYTVEDGWSATGDVGISIDGRYAAMVEMRTADRVAEDGSEDWVQRQFEKKPLCRIRIVETYKAKNWVAVEEQAWVGRPQLRPKRDQVLYRQLGPRSQVSARIWMVNLDGKQRVSLRPLQGEEETGPEYWTADGKLVGYAHYPDATGRKATVRTLNPDTREELVLGRCTQFWHVMGNSDNSAVAGECRSKAGPNIYVLFPLIQRELTVCEHGSSRKTRAALPRPAFSPDSQWVYFSSDRQGAPGVYRAPVSDWVEKTD